METFIVYPKNEKQLAEVEAALKELDVPFIKEDNIEYDLDFIEKIERSRQELVAGKVTRVDISNLKDFLGLK